jgi:diphthine methyl ester synthase
MGLFVIGLGLGDERDITVRGLEIVKKCSVVYLEYYTSVLGVDSKRLVCLFSLFSGDVNIIGGILWSPNHIS